MGQLITLPVQVVDAEANLKLSIRRAVSSVNLPQAVSNLANRYGEYDVVVGLGDEIQSALEFLTAINDGGLVLNEGETDAGLWEATYLLLGNLRRALELFDIDSASYAG